MSFEQQLKAETGLPDKYVEILMHYMRFLQREYQEEQARETAPAAPIRKSGRYQGKGWMAEDFDAPLEDFKEYIKTESFDYTKWQRKHYDAIPPEQLREDVKRFCAEHPFQGKNAVRL